LFFIVLTIRFFKHAFIIFTAHARGSRQFQSFYLQPDVRTSRKALKPLSLAHGTLPKQTEYNANPVKKILPKSHSDSRNLENIFNYLRLIISAVAQSVQ
jgi:hypothetical protein